MEYDPRKHGITQSKLTAFLQCRQRALYQVQGIGWEDASEREALWFGSMFHWLLEHYHGGRKKITTDDWIKHKQSTREKNEFNPAKMTQDESNLIYVGQLLFDLYKDKWERVHHNRKYVALESEFCVPFKLRTGEVVFLRGKRDGLGLKVANGSEWLFETKTASRHNENQKVELLQFDFQTLYYILCTEWDTGKRLAGVWYNIVRKPGIVQLARESVTEYRQRVADAIRKNPTYFAYQYEVAFTPSQKRQGLSELTRIVNEFMEWYDDRVHRTYKNTSACTAPYTCGYIKACVKVGDYTKVKGMGPIARVHPELEEDEINASKKVGTARSGAKQNGRKKIVARRH